MSDNESTHMSEAVAQFTTLKSSIDLSIANNANSRIAPTPVFVRSPSVPQEYLCSQRPLPVFSTTSPKAWARGRPSSSVTLTSRAMASQLR